MTPAAAKPTGSTPATTTSSVAGTLSTHVFINRFRAVGRRVVGQGTAVSHFTDRAGKTSTTRKQFRLTLRSWRHAYQGETVCQILFLQLGTLDLTLAGLHVVLKADDPTMPVQLTLQADDQGGVLGRLFCQLSRGLGLLSTHRKAVLAAKRMTKRMMGTSIVRARATIYAPGSSAGSADVANGKSVLQATECPVLHLVLGPLHLNLLGLIVDLNKVDLDLTAIPGTLLGNIFCQLSPPRRPHGPGELTIRCSAPFTPRRRGVPPRLGSDVSKCLQNAYRMPAERSAGCPGARGSQKGREPWRR